MNLKIMGSALIIAGTALGAGMLAIPMVLAQFGLLWGTLLMLIIWSGTTYAALLLLEASIKAGGGLSMNTIARKTLGKGGQVVTNGLLYALLVCLLMAYIIGAGDLVKKMAASAGLELTMLQTQVAFTLIAGVVVAAGTAVVDKLNRVLFGMMLVVLVMTLFSLVPSISMENLLTVTSDSKVDLIKTSSVLFTSFGFMVVIPSLVTYNEGASQKQLRNMVVIGSIIPLFCYLLWLYAAVGNLTSEQLVHFANVSELIAALGTKYSSIHTILSVFTGLALLTSFLGVAMSLYHQNEDAFKQNRVVTYVLTFIFPLIGALLAADQFLAVLGYAGIILVFLAIFVPMAMTVKVRQQDNDQIQLQAAQTAEGMLYQASGGNIALGLSFLFGCFLLMAQVI
ncbi:amino acid permease [Photobacterium sanguinicancri]|uniref:Aromatic amino acid transport family protein n=1 Tax=Photobacterium sanguinicancri TaxID=875932 RepID=A0AAW7Y1L0_9GAMM|nr:aromatic amino acid transport family protein [Photobacterium sanguinicancri]KXI22453.1 tyrosine transporter [Photobacterium sanguinicancri]MDO6542262.1 aromatic amino acid transport family protein [Photobacterium sanguinicancri]